MPGFLSMISIFPAFLLLENPALVVIFLPVLLFSLTFHEAAHAWMAARLGDPTARLMGRLTLNPLAHLDVFGTLMLFLSNFRFGWAKPVPVDPRNFADTRRGMFLTSAAGPASNFVLAIACGFAVRMLIGSGFGHPAASTLVQSLGRVFGLGVIMNLSLAFFNLIPLPPLDGSKILYGIAPLRWEAGLVQLERIGPMLLMVLIFAGFMLPFSPIWMLLGPPVSVFTYVLSGLPFGHLIALVYS
ncbi:MAG TPA: site-2 protease family protein [Acidobacteriota bacterium]|nr:site-2 protease family protein [Acidobacteriota bacterium]